MDIDFEHIEFEVLRTLHEVTRRELLEGLLNGATWEEVAQKRYELVQMEAALYKRMEHRLTPAETQLRRSR
jgi:hypothetical protein